MEWITEIIVRTPEYRSWGWNLATTSFLLTALFTFGLQLPGLINQARTIWKNRSAEGVEMLTFVTFTTYFAVFAVYALATKSGAGIVNTWVLLIPQLYILAGIARFKPLRSIDFFAVILGLLLLGMTLALEAKELMYTIASIAVFIGLALQPIAMIRSKTSANVAISFPLGFAFVCVVWTIYGLAIGDWYIAGASGAFMLEYMWTAALWFKYRSTTVLA